MEINWYIVLVSGIIPNIIGFFWYGPLFGKTWSKEAGVNPDPQNVNIFKMISLTLVFGILLAIAMVPAVIHQWSVVSAMATPEFYQPGSASSKYYADFMEKFGGNFRTFRHGALHGFIMGLTIFFPVIGCNALYERKSWKYTFLNAGFWTMCAMIMGGIICAFA